MKAEDVRVGEMKLMARGIILDELADKRGLILWQCGCGKTFRGIIGDETFHSLVYGHAYDCVSGGMAQYPEETAFDGYCLECIDHPQQNGAARCKHRFVDGDGKVVGRCQCRNKAHETIIRGDASMRRR